MTVASDEKKLQGIYNLICHVAKVKAATSAHSMADVILFFRISIFASNPTLPLNPKKIYFIYNKEKNIRNIFRTLMFQQLLAIKHHRLRDSMFRSQFGRVEVWVWSPTKKIRLINPVQSKNRARPMAARLIINPV